MGRNSTPSEIGNDATYAARAWPVCLQTGSGESHALSALRLSSMPRLLITLLMAGLVGSGFGCRQNAGSGSSGTGRSTAQDPQSRDTHGQPSNVEQGNPPGSHRGGSGPAVGAPAAGDNPGARGEMADGPSPANGGNSSQAKTPGTNPIPDRARVSSSGFPAARPPHLGARPFLCGNRSRRPPGRLHDAEMGGGTQRKNRARLEEWPRVVKKSGGLPWTIALVAV